MTNKTDSTEHKAQTELQIDRDPIERVLTGTEPDEYIVDLTAGEFYAMTVLQISVDVIIDIYGPDGEQLASVDTFTADGFGPEEWNETAPATGQYRFVLRKYDTKNPDGKYTMVVNSSQRYLSKWVKENIKSPRMGKLWLDYASNPNAVDEFLAEREGKGPLIEPKDAKRHLVTFFLKAPPGTSRVELVGGPTILLPTLLEEIGDTQFWFVTLYAPKDSRFSYKFHTINRSQIGGTWINKETYIEDASNPLGDVLVLEDAPKQAFDAPVAPETPLGEVVLCEMQSAFLGEKRIYSVYTPPNFDAASAGAYGVLFIFDGGSYGTLENPAIDTPKIMNNAIAAGKVPPLIMVLVNNMGLRDRDLVCYEPFAGFMATELLPEIRRLYPAASLDPTKIIVAGSSFGGVASTYCAMMHPEAFGNVLSQSGSYWVPGNDWKIDAEEIPTEAFFPSQFAERERLPIRFYMEVGTFENTQGQLRTNRHLRDVLKLKGYDVTYSEFHGNHDYGVWRGTIVDGIACLTRDWK